MAAAKERVSIVRVARLPANQLHPDEKYVQLDKNKSKQNHLHVDKTSPDITGQRVRQKRILFIFRKIFLGTFS